MIIFLDCKAEELSALKKSEVSALLNDLLLAAIKGNHLVIIERKTCSWVSENITLNDREREKLNQIRESHTTTASILQNAKFFLKIVMGGHSARREDNSVFSIGHSSFLNSKICDEPSSLILENSIYDGKFYELILEKTRKLMNISSISMTCKNGGGAPTAGHFKKSVDDGFVSVCIVDTDKASPNSGKSDTCKKVLRLYEKIEGSFVGRVFITPVAEAENFIPLKTYREIQSLNNLEISEELEKASLTEFWNYFDIKMGFCGKTFVTSQEPSEVKWLARTLSCTIKQIESLKFPPISKHALSLFLDCNIAQREFDKVVKSKNWIDVFFDFFAEMIWFFCADTKIRVI